jgi:hypothetical protein
MPVFDVEQYRRDAHLKFLRDQSCYITDGRMPDCTNWDGLFADCPVT